MKSKKQLFEEAPVLNAVLSLALPSIMGQVILVIYNIADTLFVSFSGSDEMITAVTVCMPAFMFLSAISNLFGVGGASVISRALGSNRKEKAKQVSAFSIWGCIVVTVLYCSFAGLFLSLFVDLLGGSAPGVHENACAYLKVAVVAGGLGAALSTLMAHLLRSEGYSMHASIGIAIGGVLNICLDPLFMFVLLRPGNEALGAAVATAISNAIAVAYYAILLRAKKDSLVIGLKPGKRMLEDNIPKSVLVVGIPACLMTLCENISYAVLEKLMVAAGTAAQAGVGVAKKVNMLAHCIVRGMSQGVLPLIGYNYSSGNRRRMRKIVTCAGSISVALSVLCMAACLLFAKYLIGIFIQPPSSSHDYGIAFLKIFCIGAPFSAFAYTVISFFQATGQGVKSLILALMRKGILDIPLMFLLNAAYPVYGIVWATPLADILCCLTAAVLFIQWIEAHGHGIKEPKAV
jgi:putative MATE family efflux protein